MLKKRIICLAMIVLALLFTGVAFATTFDWQAMDNYSKSQVDCFDVTSSTFWDNTENYSLTVDQKDKTGVCNSGFDLLTLTDASGTSIWSEDVADGTAGSFAKANWSMMLGDDEIGSTVTASQVLRTSVTQTAGMISKRVANIMSPKSSAKAKKLAVLGISGISAGDAAPQYGFWVNAGYTDWKIDSRNEESDGELATLIAGADYKITDKIVLGFSLAYENSDIDTDYNDGWVEQDGVTLAPYMAIVFNEYLSFDATLGYAWLNTDQERDKGVGNKVKSSLDSNRYFASARLNAYYNVENLKLSGVLGWLYATEDQDSFTENDGNEVDSNSVHLGQLSLGSEVSYDFVGWEPYLSATFVYDYQYDDVKSKGYDDIDQSNYDDTSFEVNPGVRIRFNNNLSADLQGGFVLGRNDYDEYSISANLRYEF
ncbi:MAG: autotransporter outer membrane beta-barrel domain-containing protein [Deltaproteobacteria bacterium]|nr:autotransporter outer membrane beta-barrel domain-containing protein [Deltaproteobacteria bacterium]